MRFVPGYRRTIKPFFPRFATLANAGKGIVQVMQLLDGMISPILA
jgi:hypothetical protein